MTIRDYRPEDLERILTIYAQAKPDEFRFEKSEFDVVGLEQDAQRFDDFQRSRVQVWADENESVEGYITWQGQKIGSLFVHPRARGRGVGRALVAAVLARLEGEVRLNVVSSNTPAQQLYDSLGFRLVGEFLGFYRDNEVLVSEMRRPAAEMES
ncbi:GNAT family N-acetyltransferase [Kushneria phosphatilytica]|uniref:GNAT family N-acetyltransferase n=1 Tax=Kushneria phosphatilytica TaxID=657387 RepID=A0A1S1NZJ0_9GAMM|nr:GNAT family N-acetyltransferase [Kushneria phosphatilytica]OHV13936.1 hypothetical protein BH688_00900 [Kushneria phosphatilytica]QEL10499.1 GNAT family N-acetyltransferase [Kushneria phosphatilytica]